MTTTDTTGTNRRNNNKDNKDTNDANNDIDPTYVERLVENYRHRHGESRVAMTGRSERVVGLGCVALGMVVKKVAAKRKAAGWVGPCCFLLLAASFSMCILRPTTSGLFSSLLAFLALLGSRSRQVTNQNEKIFLPCFPRAGLSAFSARMLSRAVR